MTKCPGCGNDTFLIGIEKAAKGTFGENGILEINETISIDVVTIECESCGEMIDRSKIADIFGM